MAARRFNGMTPPGHSLIDPELILSSVISFIGRRQHYLDNFTAVEMACNNRQRGHRRDAYKASDWKRQGFVSTARHLHNKEP